MMDVLAIGESSKSDDKGIIEVALKVGVTGRAATIALAKLGGKQVEVYRQNGELIDVGIVRGTAQKKRTKEEDDEIDGTAKIVGSKNLWKALGHLVKIDEAAVQPNQRQTKLLETETVPPKKSAGGGKALCRDCDHPWSQGKNPKRDKDGHGKQSGECYVVGCKCTAFIPIVNP